MLTRRSLTQTLCATIAALALLALPAVAQAGPPEDAVAGANKKWFSGDLMMISGTNCSILGSPYSETMVSAISSYGGDPGGGVVRVNNEYWAAVMISIPGNPCGTGSTIVSTDLSLPPGTSYDGTRPIRCFGTPRNSSTWQELTGGNWDLRPIGINATGPYCPTSPTSSATGNGIGIGYRALASGQIYQVFVPIKSTQTLVGMGNNAHRINWSITATGTYNNGQTGVWTNVFSAGSSSPSVYFARQPAAVPFWNNSSPAGQENQVEFFANVFSNLQTGNLCFYLYAGATASGSPILSCADLGGSWNGTITAASDTWQVNGGGPNGGLVPFFYGANETYTMRWLFDASSGPDAFGDVTFTTLAGPDQDNDGVPNNGADQCPTVTGNLPNGCQPSLAEFDPDGDGIIGGADQCPTSAAPSTANGCPGAGTSTDGKFGKLPALTRKGLAKGVKVPITCAVASVANAQLTVTAKVAKKLKLKVKKKAKTVTIGTGKANCVPSKSTKINVKLTKAAKRAVLKQKKAIAATLSVTFSSPGAITSTAKKAVKLK